MTYPEYGTAPIKCSKRGCKWTGLETDLAFKPLAGAMGAFKNCCPACGCDSYYFIDQPKKESK